MREKTRWAIAYQLNKLRFQCWTDLVNWAFDGTRERGLPWYPVSGCKREASRCGACYCGTFRTADAVTDADGKVAKWRIVAAEAVSTDG